MSIRSLRTKQFALYNAFFLAALIFVAVLQETGLTILFTAGAVLLLVFTVRLWRDNTLALLPHEKKLEAHEMAVDPERVQKEKNRSKYFMPVLAVICVLVPLSNLSADPFVPVIAGTIAGNIGIYVRVRRFDRKAEAAET
ncbi:hypothetical protein ACFO4L_12285 [Bacillus daqingensis]|uniref:ATP synthase subunit I n=1 Tax=Bacillus daqingensis TaxID=872396 RepID=A0ABV9NYI1_9BACI